MIMPVKGSSQLLAQKKQSTIIIVIIVIREKMTASRTRIENKRTL